MEWLIENWYMIVGLVALLVLIGSAIFYFFKQPNSVQVKKVKEWLLYAVIESERQLGNGTGKLKLRFVYDMFITKFKWMSVIISFEMFSGLVDEALEEMRHLLASNEAVKTLVNGEKDVK